MLIGALPHDDAADVDTYRFIFVELLGRRGDCDWPTFEMKTLALCSAWQPSARPLARLPFLIPLFREFGDE